jgi:hypothetical protein
VARVGFFAARRSVASTQGEAAKFCSHCFHLVT